MGSGDVRLLGLLFKVRLGIMHAIERDRMWTANMHAMAMSARTRIARDCPPPLCLQHGAMQRMRREMMLQKYGRDKMNVRQASDQQNLQTFSSSRK